MKVEGIVINYQPSDVRQKAMELTKKVYQITKAFPKDEIYGLTSQIRRCSVSVPSNIAEGRGRNSDKEFIRFLNIALGSIYELQTQLELALFFTNESCFIDINKLSIEVEKMLNALINSKRQEV